MGISRGSQWAKWDLQVHTPASLVHHYPGASEDEQWEHFLCDLASLPPEFKVIAVCDYIFLDGYERVRDAWERGLLPNLELVLPAAEFRLNLFGGTDSQLRRLNAQVIFSDELSVSKIESQFHAALRRHYTLTKNPDGREWDAMVTRESLIDLGEALIASAPPSERHRYGSPLEVGFNNLNVSLEQIEAALSSHYFEGRHLLALCRTEWDSVKWNIQSIAEKRNVINKAQLVVMSASDPDQYLRARRKLEAANVNDVLLDTSDAHYPRSSNEKDRLGNCFTWIKSKPTFKGLVHALHERERVFVGDEPEKLRQVRSKPGRFLDTIMLGRAPGASLDEIWFDNIDIPLGPDLVSIIGNKGTGKSALAESIALAGGTTVERDHFSFLTEDRFCQRRDSKARHFFAEARLADGTSRNCSLDSLPQSRLEQGIAFLPQNYLEQICADRDALEGFERELDQVVYSHVGEPEKLGQPSLKDLIRHLALETEQQLDRLRLEVHRINEKLIELRQKLSPENRKRVEQLYKSKWESLAAARRARPKRVPQPTGDPRLGQTLSLKRAEREQQQALGRRVAELQQGLMRKQAAAARMEERLKNLEGEIASRIESWTEDLELVGLTADQLMSFETRTEPLSELIGVQRLKLRILGKWLEPDEALSLVGQGVLLDRQLKALRDRLEEPSRNYESYLEDLAAWRTRVRDEIGDERIPGSLRYLRAELESLVATLPGEFQNLNDERRQLARQILGQLESLRDRYRSLQKPVADFVSSQPALQQNLGLEFAVVTEVNDLEARFFSLIHHGRIGPFHGRESAGKTLRALVDAHSFDSTSSALQFAEELLRLIDEGFSDPDCSSITLADQLMEGRKTIEVLDLLFGFEYIRPRYVLRMKGRDLKSLSPGERGLLLLVFYLMVSKDARPLIIDQPEGNLDNESIVDVLVPCIREAKKRRQIILVTHNPNLAVVCDSEQVVRASIDPLDGFRVSYQAGAIEDPAVNRWLVDVLEGTWPAFTIRRRTYFRPAPNEEDESSPSWLGEEKGDR